MRTATPGIYTYCPTLSLHAALPIWGSQASWHRGHGRSRGLRRSGRLVLLDVRGQRAQRGEDPAVLVVVRTQLEAVAPADRQRQFERVDRVQAQPRVEQRRFGIDRTGFRSEEHTSELQSLMRISYAVFCLKKN